MGKSLILFFASYKTTIALLLLYAGGLAVATIIEKYAGTEAAKIMVYYSPLFFIIPFLMITNFFFIACKKRLFKSGKWGFICVHIALIIMLTGALTTHIFSEEGVIHLREKERTNQMLVTTNQGSHYSQLPFYIELVKFTVTRYPGSTNPSSFESTLSIQTPSEKDVQTISMNNILDRNGYRFFQSSFDEDEKGTILSVNQDVAGRRITYTGYALLLVGLILFLTEKKSRFHQLQIRLKQLHKQRTTLLWVVCLITSSLSGSTLNKPIDSHHAALFGSLPMQGTDGRMKPINTFSSEVLRKLHLSETIGDLTSDQFMLGIFLSPEKWMHTSLIAVPSRTISTSFSIPEKFCAYTDLFDTNGIYKLQQQLTDIYNKPPSKRSPYEKDLIKLDDRVSVFNQLIHGHLLCIFPRKNAPDHKWYAPGDDFSAFSPKDSAFVSNLTLRYKSSLRASLETGNWETPEELLRAIDIYQQENGAQIHINPRKTQVELTYNKLNLFQKSKKLYLIAGGILLVISFISLFRRQKWINRVIRLLTIFILIGFVLHLAGFGMRWYIAGFVPWSNSYETMVLASMVVVGIGLFFARQNSLITALTVLLGGVILFVSGLNWMDPQIGTLVPVLKSPWLMFHVAILMAAYGFLGSSFLLGNTNLILLSINKKRNVPTVGNLIKELTIINEMSLWIGLALLIIGTFIGAIWANESWGRYWGWDPKETWALITILVYTVTTHLHLIKEWNHTKLLNIASVVAFLSVLMTYFGVNYFLSGMHAYG